MEDVNNRLDVVAELSEYNTAVDSKSITHEWLVSEGAVGKKPVSTPVLLRHAAGSPGLNETTIAKRTSLHYYTYPIILDFPFLKMQIGIVLSK